MARPSRLARLCRPLALAAALTSSSLAHAAPPAPAQHPLADPAYQLHSKRMQLGGWLIAGGSLTVGAGTALLVVGSRRDHPEPLCTSFFWIGPILECEEYESEADFQARRQKAIAFKGGGIVGLAAGAGLLGTGLAIYLSHRSKRERRLQQLFGPVQSLSFTPSRGGARFNLTLRF